MENQPGVSFGSGSKLLGANASQVLGMPGGTMQQTPSSPSFEPGLLPPTQGPQAPTMAQVPGSSPTPPQMPPPVGQPQQGVVGIPPGNPEALSIVKALASRLNTLSKAEEMQRVA